MREHKFENVLGDLENTEIGLFLSDQQFVEGVLLAAKQDHIVIDVNQKVHYIARQHIRALSKNAKDFHVTSKTVPYLETQNLTDVLSVMKYCSVTINGASKQALTGVLSQIVEDHIVLINQTELLYIPKSSIANIHGEISETQIRLINDKEQLSSQRVHSATVSREVEELKIHQPENVTDAVLPPENEIKSLELSSEIETQAIQDEEEQGEHQADENMSRDYLQIIEQLKRTVGLDLPDKGEVVEQQADSSQKEVHQPNVSHSIDETKDSSHSIIVENQEIQDEEQIIKGIDLEPFHLEDEENTSKVDEQEELASIFNDSKVELLSCMEPLGYERSFLLPDWKTFREELQAMSNYGDRAEAVESFTLEDHSEQLNDSPKSIELWNTPIYELQSMQELENDVQPEMIDEEGQSNNTPPASITFRRMSPKEEKTMLEKQYFSLARQAAGFSMKLEEHSDGTRFIVEPTIEDNMKSRRGNYNGKERWGSNPVADLPKGKRTVEDQYVSLMNHAAKMYQQLRDF